MPAFRLFVCASHSSLTEYFLFTSGQSALSTLSFKCSCSQYLRHYHPWYVLPFLPLSIPMTQLSLLLSFDLQHSSVERKAFCMWPLCSHLPGSCSANLSSDRFRSLPCDPLSLASASTIHVVSSAADPFLHLRQRQPYACIVPFFVLS